MAAINGGVNINWRKVLFNIFKDMVTAESRQARGFAIQISILLQNKPNLELGNSKEFPPLKILTEKTVNRYISNNDKISVEDVEGMADESRVNKTPMKKAVSKKRPATAVDEHITKKKRTRVGKAAKSSAIVTVAQESIPLRLQLPAGSADEIVEEETAVGGTAEKDSVPARADIVDKEISTADDVDNIIEQIIAETAQFETDVGGSNIGETNFGVQAVQRADEMEHWFNISYEEFVAREADSMVESGSDTDEEIVAAKATGTDTVMGAADLVDTEELSLAKDVATMMESEDTGSIPVDVMLPSVTAAEITRIKFAPCIKISGVHEGDWYKASLPQISTSEKGKAPLVKDTIKGHPAREMCSLICADIDFLVQLREKVIADVVSLFHSFSLSKLGDLELVKGIIAKEKQFLAWAETDSLETAVRRREFTITKYREMLLRKFLESHRQHFQAGQPSTATDLQIIALLSNAHIFAVETLQTQMRIHGLKWERICSSRLFEGENRDCGAVIARSNTSIRSLCWLRTKTLVYGSWVIQEGNDLWQRLPKQTVPLTFEFSPQRQFDDTLAPVSESFKVLHKQWAYVCIEVVQSSTIGSLQPVGSHNFCRDIVAVSTVIDIALDSSDFVGVFHRGTDVHMILSESISSSSGSAHPDPTVFASISQRPLDTDLTSPNPSTTDYRVFFTTDDTPMGVDQFLMPTAVTPQDFTEPLAQLRALVNQISTERVQMRNDSEKLKDMLLMEIRSLEKKVTEMLIQQDSHYRGLFNNMRQEIQIQKSDLSLDILASQRKLITQQAAIATGLDDIRKDVDETKATLSNALLEFHAQAHENYNTLS
ncbi:hypothetical protein F511_24763 [Dorcoceras hygrometricum]|uniref:Uncharacterized protein n=1 Tax=Dorcoceras hygrometricum TaxID=472368 RepID=A0A2Z7B0S2_9LAMI|nr:hypothetical protein F511_24763 [Dorcoceras hygrometricum]